MAIKDTTGVDIMWIDGLDPHFRLLSGARNVGAAVGRRIRSPRGDLFYAPDYGRDLDVYLNDEVSGASLQKMRQDAVAESTEDERVKSIKVSVSWNPDEAKIRIEMAGKLKAGGNFRLIRSIGDVTTTVLAGDE